MSDNDLSSMKMEVDVSDLDAAIVKVDSLATHTQNAATKIKKSADSISDSEGLTATKTMKIMQGIARLREQDLARQQRTSSLVIAMGRNVSNMQEREQNRLFVASQKLDAQRTRALNAEGKRVATLLKFEEQQKQTFERHRQAEINADNQKQAALRKNVDMQFSAAQSLDRQRQTALAAELSRIAQEEAAKERAANAEGTRIARLIAFEERQKQAFLNARNAEIQAENRKQQEMRRAADMQFSAAQALERQRQNAMNAEIARIQKLEAERDREVRNMGARFAQILRFKQQEQQAILQTQQAEARAAQERENARQTYVRLRSAVDPLWGSVRQYEAAERSLKQLLDQRIIDQHEYNMALQQSRAAYLAPVAGLDAMGGSMVRTGYSTRQLQASMVNAGFQIQDFAVQVASGQSAILALTQQLPQLLGALGFVGKLAMWGSALGVFVAVAGAIGLSFMRARKEAESLDKSIEKLQKSFTDYTTATENSKKTTAELRAEFGSAAESARRLYEIQAQLAEMKFGSQLSSAIIGLKAQFKGLAESIVTSQRDMNRGSSEFTNSLRSWLHGTTEEISRTRQDYGLTVAEGQRLIEMMGNIEKATSVSEQAELWGSVAEHLSNVRDASGKIPPTIQAAAEAAAEMALQAKSMAAETDGTVAAEARLAEVTKNRIAMYAEAIERGERQQEFITTQTRDLTNQIELQSTIGRFGEKSLEVESLKRQQHEQQVKLLLSENEIVGSTADELRRMAMQLYDVTEETRKRLELEQEGKTLAEETLAAIGAARQARREADDEGRKGIRAFEDQVRLNGLILEYGRDSVQVAAEQRALELAKVNAYIDQQKYVGNTAVEYRNTAMAAYDTDVAVRNAEASLKNAAGAAKDLASAIASAAGFSLNLDNGIVVLEAKLNALRHQQDGNNAATIAGMRLKAEEMRMGQLAAGQSSVIADAQYAIDMAAIDRQEVLLGQIESQTEANRGAARASKAAASAAKKDLNEMKREAEQWHNSLRTPLEEYTETYNRLNELYKAGLLSTEDLRRGTKKLNDELRDSNPLISSLSEAWGDFISSGFSDFEGFVDNVWSSFKSLISNMIATASSNRIAIMLGLGGTVGAPGVGAAAGGGAGGSAGAGGGGLSGFATNALGSWAGKSIGFGSSVLGGITGPIQAAMTAASHNGLMAGFKAYNTSLNGMGAGFNGIGAQIGAYAGPAMMGMAAGHFLSGGYQLGSGKMNGMLVNGLGTAIGAAILGPIGGLIGGALGGVVNRVFGKKLVGQGLGGTVNMNGFDGFSYQKYKGGIFSSGGTKRRGLDGEAESALSGVFATLRDGVISVADTLDIASSAFNGFSHSFQFDTKGMNQEQIQERLAQEMTNAANKMAEMALGTNEYTKTGESAMDTLTRLSNSLLAVNAMVDTLGMEFDKTGLKGAALASNLADLFGGIDQMSSAVQSYYNIFYTEEERRITLQRQMSEQLAKLNVVMPRTREEYRALISAQDLTTESGQKIYAALIQLASGMDSVLPILSKFTEEMAKMANLVSTGIGEMITATNAAMNEAKEAAKSWYAAADNIRDFLKDLDNSELSRLNAYQQLLANQKTYADALQLVMSGKNSDTSKLTQAAQNLLTSVRGTANTSVQYAREVARVQEQLRLAAGVADLEGAAEDAAITLYEKQLAVLQEIATSLENGTITPEDLKKYQETFDVLSGAINDLKSFSYESMKEKLKVSVELLATADIPKEMRDLLAAAGTDIKANIDFILRKDLAPDVKWLAMQTSSELVKTISLIGKTKDLSPNVIDLALSASSQINKTLNMLVGSKLDKDSMKIALAGNSELARVVNVTLDSKSSEQAMRLALSNAGKYAVTVSAALSDLDPTIRKLVATGAGTYAANIEAALVTASLTEVERRILLLKQGTYLANIQASLSLPPLASELMSKNSRRFDIALVSSWLGLTNEQKKVLSKDGTDFGVVIGTSWNNLTKDQRAAIEGLGSKFLTTISASFATNIKDREWNIVGGSGQRNFNTIVGATFAKGIGTNEWRVVGGNAERGFNAVISGMFAKGMTDEYRRLLINSSLTANKAVTLSATFAKSLTLEERTALLQGVQTINKTINTNMTWARGINSDGWTALRENGGTVDKGVRTDTWIKQGVKNDGLLALRATGGTVDKGVRTDTWIMRGVSNDGLLALRQANQTVQKNIKGAVDVGKLTTQQASLLQAITGTTNGTVKLDGGFVFDPSKSFSTWYESTTRTNLSTPMANLQKSLESLRVVMVQEGERSKQAAITTGLASIFGNAPRDESGMVYMTTAQIDQAAALMGVKDSTQRAAWRVRDDILNYSKADNLTTATIDDDGSKYKNKMRNTYLAPFKADVQKEYQRMLAILPATGSVSKATVKLDPQGRLNKNGLPGSSSFYSTLQWWDLNVASNALNAAINNIPAFAEGGRHRGGLAIVGENGPELADLSPSRVYNTNDTKSMLSEIGGNDSDIEVRMAIQELTQKVVWLMTEVSDNTKKSKDTLQKWDRHGAPVVVGE